MTTHLHESSLSLSLSGEEQTSNDQLNIQDLRQQTEQKKTLHQN